jgi:hypothetical protein
VLNLTVPHICQRLANVGLSGPAIRSSTPHLRPTQAQIWATAGPAHGQTPRTWRILTHMFDATERVPSAWDNIRITSFPDRPTLIVPRMRVVQS